MSLSAALGIAQSALLATSRRTSIVSQNITNADNPDYSRRTAVLASEQPGVRVAEIRRAANDALFRQNLNANSSWEGQQKLLTSLNSLVLSVNGDDNASSPATALGQLQEALQLYAATPSNANLAEGAIEAARQVVRTLNSGTDQIQTFRAQTDVEIGNAVDDINNLLAEFHVANKAVITGTTAGENITDALDQRDAILKKISQYLPVSTFTRSNNDMVITTGDGVMLYETLPRTVSFDETATYGPGTTGNPVLIDGVPLSADGPMASLSGSLTAMVKLRDDVAVTMQAQLDEIARGLIEAFAEFDQTGGGAAAAAGLFTWPGGPAVPAAGTMIDGLANGIQLNAAYDSDVGGNPVLLRDGGANGANYVVNTGGGASFADLLISWGDRLDEPMAFDTAAGLTTSVSVSEFSANSIGWLEALRQSASSAEITQSALLARTSEALSSETGVNIDLEMSLLLELEQSYEASARIIRAVDEMLATLIDLAG